eukprot:GHVQ01033806.1.p1 GENE.GHVQ01033806.1~~GHVQ01033806.1.p1  ORF type:complete len:646 (+),score=86.21 GHVQ01033806.1:1092-3029(+)
MKRTSFAVGRVVAPLLLFSLFLFVFSRNPLLGYADAQAGIAEWSETGEVAEAVPEGSLISLSDETFQPFITSNPIVFVLFYAPWCYWSRLALPEFEAAARVLSHHDPPVKLVTIDTSQYVSIGMSEGVREYPTLKLYLDENTVPSIVHSGGRQRAQLVHWVEEKLGKDKALRSAEHLAEMLSHGGDVVVVAVLPPDDKNALVKGKSFMRVGREFGENIVFAHTNSTEIHKRLEEDFIKPRLAKSTLLSETERILPNSSDKNASYVVVFTPHPKEDSVYVYRGSVADRKSLREFVKTYEFPAVVPFTLQRASRVFEDGRPLCVLVVDTGTNGGYDEAVGAGDTVGDEVGVKHGHVRGEEDHHVEVLHGDKRQRSMVEEAFWKVAQMERGEFLFTISGNVQPHEKRLLSLIGVDDDTIPAIRIVSFSPVPRGVQNRVVLKFRPEDNPSYKPPSNSPPVLHTSLDNLNSSDALVGYVRSFVDAYRNKLVKPYLKSEALIPEEDNTAPVRVLVGNSFDSEVRASPKDVFVEFYAPWCGHCRKLEPALKELAARLKSVPQIVIAKMDATRNEVRSLQHLAGYPTLMYFAANKKDRPETYRGDRSVADMIRWIEKQSTVQFSADQLLALDITPSNRPAGLDGEELISLEEL